MESKKNITTNCFLLTPFVLLLFSSECIGQKIPTSKKYPSTEIINIVLYPAYQKREEYSLSTIAESLKYIPLETNDKSLLGTSLIDISIISKEIFLMDFGLGAYRFSLDGKFLNRIGQIGRGPKECIKPIGLVLDSISKNVTLLDHDKLVVYDYNGNFKKKYSLGFNSGNMMLFKENIILLDDMFYLFQKAEERFSLKFYSVEKQKVISQIACEKKDKIPFCICDPIIYTYNNQTYIKDYWSDTIYKVMDPYNLKAYAVIETGKFKLRENDDKSVFTGTANPNETWIVDINYISETDRFLILVSNKGLFVHDKVQKETICCNLIKVNNVASHFRNDITPGPNPKVFIYNNTVNNNAQVTFNTALSFFVESSNKLSPGLDKSLQNLKPEDNQVLLIIKFKDK